MKKINETTAITRLVEATKLPGNCLKEKLNSLLPQQKLLSLIMVYGTIEGTLDKMYFEVCECSCLSPSSSQCNLISNMFQNISNNNFNWYFFSPKQSFKIQQKTLHVEKLMAQIHFLSKLYLICFNIYLRALRTVGCLFTKGSFKANFSFASSMEFNELFYAF